MKTLYKVIIVISLLLLSSGMKAQFGSKFITELRSGINFSEMDIAGANMYKQTKIGFNITGSFSMRLAGPLYMQTGAALTKKGLKQHDKSEWQIELTGITVKNDIKSTIDANYVQVPLMLGFEIPVSRVCSLNIYGGGYGAYGFKGKTKVRGTETRYPDSPDPAVIDRSQENVDTFDSGQLKKIDYGAIGSVGLVVDVLSFNLGYEYGLFNVSDNASRELKNRNITFSLGVRF